MAALLRVTVEVARLTAAGFTVTDAVWVIVTVPLATALMVFPSALVDEKLAVKTPLPLVVPLAAGEKLLVVPVAASATEAPGITLPNMSRTVAVMSEVLVPP